MKNLYLIRLKRFLVRTITVFPVASCTKPSYANGVHPHGELALVGYKLSTGAQSARAFFVRNTSMRQHLYGEAGGGHFRVCWYPSEPVDQPPLALPPSLGREWQGFY